MPEITRSIVVTGASAGIGAALARAAAAAGYAVTVVARRAQRLEEVASSIRSQGGKVVALAGDVTADTMPERIVATATGAFGRIDVVVNNAGAGAFGRLLDQSDAAIESQWRLHVTAPLRLARRALPHLEATRGQLVFIGSGAARVPLPNYGAYALAKAAVRAAAIQLRRELRERGVAVTYVDPGLVASEFHTAMGIERESSVPAASPQRVARAILRGITRRAAVVNAVPWQTAGAALGEWLGALSDPVIVARFAAQKPEAAPVPVEAAVVKESSFAQALEPVARRMERVKLPARFLHDALVPGTTLELNDLAMRWAGMPNKNERAVMHEALDALASGGFLEPATGESWKVLREAD
ncbi:MAG: SDR family NAD(P)-dependent oxidoreductase [Candidatus Cybelea sp.]